MTQTTPRDSDRFDSARVAPDRFDADRSGPGRRNLSLGDRGEALAAVHLEGLGCEVLARNWRAGRQGELDLVVRDGGSIVAVEAVVNAVLAPRFLARPRATWPSGIATSQSPRRATRNETTESVS